MTVSPKLQFKCRIHYDHLDTLLSFSSSVCVLRRLTKQFGLSRVPHLLLSTKQTEVRPDHLKTVHGFLIYY